MIYGLNFNSTQIPPGYAKKFRKRIKRDGMSRYEWSRLEGVAESEQEAKMMIIQASNGRRRLWIEVRQTARGPLYGVYVY